MHNSPTAPEQVTPTPRDVFPPCDLSKDWPHALLTIQHDVSNQADMFLACSSPKEPGTSVVEDDATRSFNLAKLLNLVMFSESTFYRLQKEYLFPVIHTNYVMQQDAVLEFLRGNNLKLSGDDQCDSPGYSTKYCTYSLMDSATDLILDYKLIQSSETGSSVAMEKEGLGRSLNYLLGQDVSINTIATDRHRGKEGGLELFTTP